MNRRSKVLWVIFDPSDLKKVKIKTCGTLLNAIQQVERYMYMCFGVNHEELSHEITPPRYTCTKPDLMRTHEIYNNF